MDNDQNFPPPPRSVELPALLTQDQAAAYLGMTGPALAQRRTRGDGPPYVKVGKFIRYRATDIDAWLSAHLINPEQVDITSLTLPPRRRASAASGGKFGRRKDR